MYGLLHEAYLDALERLSREASPGPWAVGSGALHPWEVVIAQNVPLLELWDTSQGLTDAAFISAARDAIPRLLAENRRLRALLGTPAHDAQEAVAQLEEATATIILASELVEPEHPAWIVLDGYDGSGDACRELVDRGWEPTGRGGWYGPKEKSDGAE